MLDLIPAPVKTTPTGRVLTISAAWHYPRSEAYEAEAAKRLSHGWTLYSAHKAKEIAAGRRTVGAEHVGRDWGAFRLGKGDSAIATVQGIRAADGSPAYLRAWVRSIGDHPAQAKRFGADEIGQAAYWCDSILGEYVAVSVLHHATGNRLVCTLWGAANGLSDEEYDRVRTEVLKGAVVSAKVRGERFDFELAQPIVEVRQAVDEIRTLLAMTPSHGPGRAAAEELCAVATSEIGRESAIGALHEIKASRWWRWVQTIGLLPEGVQQHQRAEEAILWALATERE